MSIYHYCSLNSFYLIVKNKTLRLSDITKSNDSMEIIWITQYIKNTLLEIFESEQAIYFTEKYTAEILDKLIDGHERDYFGNTHKQYTSFVCCFSEAGGDVLSQWRGYADDGKGISIGFDDEIFKGIGRLASDDSVFDSELLFDKVEYIDSKQKRIVRDVGDELIRNLKIIIKEINTENIDALIDKSMPAFNYAFLQLFKRSMFMKNAFFKEEKEWRICHWNAIPENKSNQSDFEKIDFQNNIKFGKLSFQCYHNSLIPYVDLDFSKFEHPLINDIVIGPKSEVSKLDIMQFMANCNFEINESNIRKSKGTYR